MSLSDNNEKVFGAGRYSAYLRDVEAVGLMLAAKKVLEENPKVVEDIKNGKNKDFSFLIEQIKIKMPKTDSKYIMRHLKSRYFKK